MRNIKLSIEYDGTNFFGWQTQNNLRTVQSEIENIGEKFLKHKIKLIGAGRTDTGVHAKGQIANFKTEVNLSCKKILSAFNGLLPNDIAIYDVEDVDIFYNSRFDAKLREYSYTISKIPTAILKNFSIEIFYPLDIKKMNKCAKNLIGKFDFSSFCKSIDEVKNTICEVKFAEWREENQLLIFSIKANRFIHGMVRAIVGTLIDVGRKKISIEEFNKIFFSKNRIFASQSAPSKGLTLEKVIY